MFLEAAKSKVHILTAAQITLIVQGHWTFKDLQTAAKAAGWRVEQVSSYIYKFQRVKE